MAGDKKKTTKKSSKVDPKILGTGAARKAGEALKGRKKQIEDKLREAGAKASPKKKKKTQYA